MTTDSLRDLLARPEVGAVHALGKQRGAPVLLVGGAVRDALLGNAQPHDLDFAVQGDAIALSRAVADALRAHCYVLDAERGAARVLLPLAGASPAQPAQSATLVMDFTVCRGDSWRDDLIARDFTVNAIGVDLDDGSVLDATSGLADLHERVIRATTDHAVTDDPVRALRGIRLAFALGMRIEPGTLDQIAAVGAAITRPSAERVRDEFMAILNVPDAGWAVRQLDALHLLVPIVPEIEPMRTCEPSPPDHFSVLDHAWEVLHALDRLIAQCRSADGGWLAFPAPIRARLLQHLDAAPVEGRTRVAVLRFAALLHDCGKPATKTSDAHARVHFYGHAAVSAELAAARARALRLSGNEAAAVRTLVRYHMCANRMARRSHAPTPRARYRFFRDVGDCAPELALFAVADCMGQRRMRAGPGDCAVSVAIAQSLLDEYYARYERTVAPPPLITGRDVIALGVKQGPRIGQILDAVREAQMIGEIHTREQALALAGELKAQWAIA